MTALSSLAWTLLFAVGAYWGAGQFHECWETMRSQRVPKWIWLVAAPVMACFFMASLGCFVMVFVGLGATVEILLK